MYYFLLYLNFIKINLQSIFEYRKAFWYGQVCMITSYVTDIALIWVLISRFKTINGWGPYEIMFLYALNLCAYSIAGVLLRKPTIALPSMIQSGEFDDILIRPLNPFFYTITREAAMYFSQLTVSAVTLTICIMKLQLTINPASVGMLILVIISGALIQGAIDLFAAIPAFWLIKSDSIKDLLIGDIRSFTRYPISIYNRSVQVFLTLIVPYAFISFYPAQFFLKKNDFIMFHPVFQYLTPAIGIILIVLAYKFWNAGVRHYNSTGS